MMGLFLTCPLLLADISANELEEKENQELLNVLAEEMSMNEEDMILLLEMFEFNEDAGELLDDEEIALLEFMEDVQGRDIPDNKGELGERDVDVLEKTGGYQNEK
jgi:archaellum biogenesis ATPase FlaH